MKISTAGDDLLIIHCERFESGKVSIENPNTILTLGLPSFFVLVYISQLSLVQFESYLNKHLLLVLSITFFLITTAIGAIHDIFFKSPSIRTSFIYQVDRNGCFSSYDGKVKIISGVNIEEQDNLVESLKIVVDMPIGSYEEDTIYISSEIFYKVIVELNLGKCFSIEENSIEVYSHPENQVAFHKLTTETNSAVEQIKSFLKKSKNL
ncbi:hypothetical protein [Chamaesiphon sp.]|uniref:hypothetical protein n=1 Tax=Chamaesiphon sp. TaxID=2814140 RepID=UPI003593E2C7